MFELLDNPYSHQEWVVVGGDTREVKHGDMQNRQVTESVPTTLNLLMDTRLNLNSIYSKTSSHYILIYTPVEIFEKGNEYE